MLLHMPTVSAMFAAISVIGVSLLCVEWGRTGKAAPALWALAFAVVSTLHLIGTVLAANGTWTAFGAPAMRLLGSALMAQGCFAFVGRRGGIALLTVPLPWLALWAVRWHDVPFAASGFERQVVSCVLMVFMCAVSASVFWRSKVVTSLRVGIALVFGLHALAITARVAITGSITLQHGAQDSDILFAFFIIETFVFITSLLFLFVGATKDQTADRWREEAQIDPLTGLLNRKAFIRCMRSRTAAADAMVLMLIDLDRFKTINDTYGHGLGDELLIQVAARIGEQMEPGTPIARLGGDEFAVWKKGAQTADATAGMILSALSHPFQIGNHYLQIGCSIGICSSDTVVDPSDLLKKADLALYEVKHKGGRSTLQYQPGMLEALKGRSQMENDLRLALRDGQLRLAYQPILRLGDDKVVGYEALIRWHHPVSGMISPATFIPVAEKTEEIICIGEWVLKQACRQAATWPSYQRIAVNVSPVQFRSPLLLSHVVAALSESGLPPHRLEIELTETAMVEDGAQIAQVLASLRTLGVGVAMDDFGTGYSSLAHLRDFPLDRVKIDRSFVTTAQTDPRSMAILKGIIQISHELNAVLVGEGVETVEQLELLRSLGCDCVQGYLIGRPMEAPEGTAWRAA